MKQLEKKEATREERVSLWVTPETKKLLEKFKGNQSVGMFVTELVNNYIILKNNE